MIPYVLWLALAYRYHLVDGMNLGAHEAGHMVLRFSYLVRPGCARPVQDDLDLDW